MYSTKHSHREQLSPKCCWFAGTETSLRDQNTQSLLSLSGFSSFVVEMVSVNGHTFSSFPFTIGTHASSLFSLLANPVSSSFRVSPWTRRKREELLGSQEVSEVCVSFCKDNWACKKREGASVECKLTRPRENGRKKGEKSEDDSRWHVLPREKWNNWDDYNSVIVEIFREGSYFQEKRGSVRDR